VPQADPRLGCLMTDHSTNLAMGIALTTAATATALATPPVRWLAFRLGAVDHEGPRRFHRGTTPRMGGVPLAFGVIVGVVCAWLWSAPWYVSDPRCWGLAGGAILILLLGILDDMRSVRPRYKLLVQAGAATCAYMVGLRIEILALPAGGSMDLGWFGLPITLLWIVGVTNAMNLLDGLDGLAAGVTILIAAALLLVGTGRGGTPAYVAVGAGATIGACFVMGIQTLRRRKMFLGDSGSLCLGFILANLALLACKHEGVAISPALPFIMLGLPIADTLASVVRRILLGRSPFSADRGHIHHALLSLGMTPRRVVMVLWGLAAIYGLIGLAVAAQPVWVGLLAVPAIAIFPGLVYWRLGYFSVRAWSDRRRLERILKRIIRRIRLQNTPGELHESARRACRLLNLDYVCIRRGTPLAPELERRKPLVELGRPGCTGEPKASPHPMGKGMTITAHHHTGAGPLVPDAHEAVTSPVLRALAGRVAAIRIEQVNR